MIFGNARMVIGTGYAFCYVKSTYWQALPLKAQAKRSIPHSENEHQWNLNVIRPFE
jgi:hypothetical protein